MTILSPSLSAAARQRPGRGAGSSPKLPAPAPRGRGGSRAVNAPEGSLGLRCAADFPGFAAAGPACRRAQTPAQMAARPARPWHEDATAGCALADREEVVIAFQQMTDRPCEFCGEPVPLIAMSCPHCGRPSLFPNVREAEAGEERAALARRFEIAVEAAERR